ncbi:MAG: YqaJ viral recombinase family protein [Sutterella wadsworthensis]|nr:YqaJ viral recombinase family protein [Sutterella wadsworthensis]
MQIIQLDQRTAEWHEWRKKGWTATEAAILLCMSTFEDLHGLWELKVGRKTPPDLSRVPAVQYGVAHEDDCRQCWEQRHGEKAEPVCGECSEHPLFRASFDGLTSSGVPVECKCIPKQEAFDDVKLKGEQSDRYKRYWLQVQHQMLVSGSDHAWLCFWHEGQFLEYRVERNDSFIRCLVEFGEKFWADYVVTGIEPGNMTWQPEGDDAERWQKLAERHLADMAMREKLAKALKVIEDRMKVRLDQFAAIMGEEHKTAEADGLKVTRVERAGSYDYKSYCVSQGVSEEALKPFWKEGSSYLKVARSK